VVRLAPSVIRSENSSRRSYRPHTACTMRIIGNQHMRKAV
jgi:hypothetical protein